MTGKSDKYRKKLLDNEIGTVRQRWNGHLKIALAYPNTYHVGMSNLGFQIIYRLLNRLDGVICERVFLKQATDENPVSITSFESSKPVTHFDILAVSISFENDYLNLLSLLKQAGLPLRSKERHPPHPLVMAGGVTCILNPEPIADFIDCFLIGEAEALLPQFIECFDPTEGRPANLKRIARQVPGAYVPIFYKPTYKKDGKLSRFKPVSDVPESIRHVRQEDISSGPATGEFVTPYTTFKQSYLVELGRGCPHGCRFCAAGYIYRPPRFRPLPQTEKCLHAGIAQTNRIGLVGAAVSDYPDIGNLCRQAKDLDIRLSFSSLRADALTPELLSALKDSGVKTATIAPDAGSERMRKVINKGLNEEVILNAAESLVSYGIPNLKLYFMLGLPTETVEDVEAIVSLCKKIKHCFLKSSQARKRIGEITVSLNSFVPKAATPFQWVALDEVALLKTKIKKVRQGLKTVPNIRVNADVPRWAYIQALLSRGDRRVAQLMETALENQGNWAKTLKASMLNSDFYVYRERLFTEHLPWDFIDHGIKKSFLIKEYQKALKGESTALCHVGSCHACGVC